MERFQKEMNSAHTEPNEPDASHDLRIVLLGSAGVGKSAAGNVILGRTAFEDTSTRVSEIQRGTVENRNISVIDTPGFFNTKLTDEELKNEMKKSLSLSDPGPHVFLLVIRLDRFTEDVWKIVKQIQENFGKEAFRFTMVLFTGREVMSKREWIEFRLSKKTRELLSYCEEKCHVIIHKSKHDANQINSLLENIDEIVRKNGREHYTQEICLKIREERTKTQEDENIIEQQEKDKRENENGITYDKDIKNQEEDEKKNRAEDSRQEPGIREEEIEWSDQKDEKETYERDGGSSPEERSQHTGGHQSEKEHGRCLVWENKRTSPASISGIVSDLRIVLLGRTGSGTSETGNIILGRDAFRENKSFISVTFERREADVCGRTISVIRTPGLLDTSISDEMKAKLEKCVEMSAPGPHAFLLVIRLDVKYTEEEKNTVKWIQKNFGEDAVNYTIILFTHADQLKGESLDEFIRESSDLQTLIDSCGGRYHSFNNKDLENRSHVTELLEKIEEMVERNGGTHYTNEMFSSVQERIEKKAKEDRLQWYKGVLIFIIGALAAAAVAKHGLEG